MTIAPMIKTHEILYQNEDFFRVWPMLSRLQWKFVWNSRIMASIALVLYGKFSHGQNSDFRAEFGKNNVSIAPKPLYKKSMAFQWANTPPAPKFLFPWMPKTHAISLTLTCNFYAYYFRLCYDGRFVAVVNKWRAIHIVCTTRICMSWQRWFTIGYEWIHYVH